MRRSVGTRVAIACLGLLAAGGAACSRPEEEPPPEPEPATRRETPQGAIVGFRADNGAHVWRGVPFAQPPIGPLRWRAPRPPAPWSETRMALEFAAACPQLAGPGGRPDGASADEPVGDEDCLYANVFAPPFAPEAVPTGAERLPVMVWIHGGGNTIGDATLYDGGVLAVEQRVVVVTLHYRLGVFGWFSHPALRAGAPSSVDRSGNYGVLDLIRALEWVRANIAAYGGDPNRVTVFGESAGGRNVFSLLRSPRARGLFHGAIVESGTPTAIPVSRAENLVDAAEPGHPFSSGEVLLRLLIADSVGKDREEAKQAVGDMTEAEIADYLRHQSVADLLAVYEGSRLGGMYDMPRTFRDGVVIPDVEANVAFGSAAGHNRVPVLLGTNRDETKLFMAFGSDHVTRLFRIPLRVNQAAYDLDAEYGSLMWKATGVDEPAEAISRLPGSRVYAYRFDWDEEPSVLWVDLAKLFGACHAVEIPFVFGTLDLGRANRFVFDEERRPAAEALSRAMTSYWANFAYTGSPGRGRDGSLPEWSAWGAKDDSRFMVLDTETGGGLRMSGDSVSKASILARALTDERFADLRERCTLYRSFVEYTDRLTAEEYDRIGDGACAAQFPLDEFPWDG